MAKYKHLTLDDRIQIQSYLDRGFTFKEISIQLHKSPSTIAKEVHAHLTKKPGSYGIQRFNPCVNRIHCVKVYICGKDKCSEKRRSCSSCGKCNDICKDFDLGYCKKLEHPPYCCNACIETKGCCLTRKYYYAQNAHEEYRKTLIENRQGVCISRKEAERISSLIQPLIAKGHSVHHACTVYKEEIMLSEKTVYTYIDSGVFNIKNIDLPRKVRYKQRKKKSEAKVDPQCREGRTYEDFLAFMQEHDSPPVVQMDSVKGTVSGKVLLTLHFVESGFMVAYLRNTNTAKSVRKIFEDLYETLGQDDFIRLFPVILTDNGSEFSDPTRIEFDKYGERRTYIFYCDRNRSDQKGSIEVNHEFIRRISPKGVSFDNRTQEDIFLMMSHINSYRRKRLNNLSPYTVFSMLYGSDIAAKLGITEIPAEEVILTPKLFKK